MHTTRTVYFYFLCKIWNFWCAALSHICCHIALWNMDMEFITLWNPGVKKQPNVYTWKCMNIRECECKCLFLIFVHANANANSKKTCEYSDHHYTVYYQFIILTRLEYLIKAIVGGKIIYITLYIISLLYWQDWNISLKP